jgi:hypothetical protein
LFNASDIDALAIVHDFDVDLATLMKSPQN